MSPKPPKQNQHNKTTGGKTITVKCHRTRQEGQPSSEGVERNHVCSYMHASCIYSASRAHRDQGRSREAPPDSVIEASPVGSGVSHTTVQARGHRVGVVGCGCRGNVFSRAQAIEGGQKGTAVVGMYTESNQGTAVVAVIYVQSDEEQRDTAECSLRGLLVATGRGCR